MAKSRSPASGRTPGRLAAGESVSAQAIRRAALHRLLAQPTDRDRRPCAGCTSTCGCGRASSSCCCGCGPSCPQAPVALSAHPARRPVHPTYMPVLYGLVTSRMFTPVWPVHDHYCRFPTTDGVGVRIRTEQLEYADLLTHDIAYLSVIGLLSASWRVSLAPHLSGLGETTLVLEPCDAQVGLEALARDLRSIGEALPARLRRLAQARLCCLRDPSTPPGQCALSAREGEVLDLLLAGLGVATIARQLFISPHTARNHIKHICTKLDVASQTELRELFAAVH